MSPSRPPGRTPKERRARQEFKDIVAQTVDGDQAQAEVLMQRIADRLGGYTHAEAVERNPMPGEAPDA